MKTVLWSVCGWLCLLMLQGPAGAAARNVAIAMDRAGEVEVVTAGRAARLNLLDYLPEDAELKLAAGAKATLVYLGTSVEWNFIGPGRHRLGAELPVRLEGAAALKGAATSTPTDSWYRLDPSRRDRMTLGAVVMRSASPQRIVGPDNVDVLASRPTLMWQGSGTPTVHVSVSSAQTQEVLAQADVEGLQWTVPKVLPPGDYIWRIDAGADAGSRNRVSRFTIVDPEAPRYAPFRKPPLGFAQRLTRAIQLEAEGLPYDATLILQSLAAERPDEDLLRAWRR